MRTTRLGIVFAAGLLAGCMAGSLPVPAQDPQGRAAPSPAARIGTPLILDRTDLKLGTTVQFDRIPSVAELAELTQTLHLSHLVLNLPAWPTDFAPLQPLDHLPYGADVIVVLPGYPPTRGATEVWGYVNAALRIVVVVDGPPPSSQVVADLNTMRSLERVIAHLDHPARSGFERLQRPLSFRKVMP